MVINFAGKNWDTKKTYYAGGHETTSGWMPYEDVEDLSETSAGTAKTCRIVRIFIGDDGEVESLLFQVTGIDKYCIIRLGWTPVEFVDTTERKVLANIKKLMPKKTTAEKKTVGTGRKRKDNGVKKKTV